MGNYPDNVDPNDRNAPWNQEEEGHYYEIHLDELIQFCGGRDRIIGHDEPYHFMIEKMNELVNDYLRKYDEVGELHPETIQDYVDNITSPE